MDKEEERAMAITHWDALILQWKEEQKTSRFNYKSATQREQRFYEIERTKALQELEKGQSPKGEKPMAFELREGQGSLFENRDKKNERHPDFKGDVKIGGKTYRLAAWTKQTKAGKLFYSLSVDRQDLPASDGGDVDRAIPKEEDEIRF